MDLLYILIACFGGLGVGGMIAYFLFRPKAKLIEETARREAARIMKNAERDADRMLQDGRKQVERMRQDTQREESDAKRRLDKQIEQTEERLARRESVLEEKIEKAEASRQDYEDTAQSYQDKKKELDKKLASQNEALEKIAKLTQKDAKTEILERMEKEIEPQLADTLRKRVSLMKEQADKEAANIIVQSVQRQASGTTAETTTTVVTLKSDDQKGKIIGREGRNINAFEMIAGVDVIIDDTPGTITIASFDMFRRYVAKIALEELLKDGRIHPSSIEQAVKNAEDNAEKMILQLGKEAEEELGIVGSFPDEVLKLVGRLRFRTSYGQNVLKHSVEVAWLAEAIAQQIPGADPLICKKAGLVHDMGKSVSHEVEGGHALIGRDILQKFGVAEPIWRAMESHHEDVPYTTLESRILQAADAISASRPGARRESLEKYIKRLKELEGIAGSFKGVDKVYAIQAGREVRVFVNSAELTEAKTEKLSFDIARKIEQNCDYPGEVQVMVIRETRYKEKAR